MNRCLGGVAKVRQKSKHRESADGGLRQIVTDFPANCNRVVPGSRISVSIVPINRTGTHAMEISKMTGAG